MSYLQRLKNLKDGPGVMPTEPSKLASVGFVGTRHAPLQKARVGAEQRPAFSVRAALVAAIHAACAAGRLPADTDVNRDELVRECCALSLEDQQDLTEHFRQEASAWTAIHAGNYGSEVVLEGGAA